MEYIGLIIALVVPIGVAIWTVRSSAHDTAKKIAALEESTTQQIESIKELTKIQIEISILQSNTELKKIAARQKILTQKVNDESKSDQFFNQFGDSFDSLRQKENRRRDLMDDTDFALNELKETHELTAQLNSLKKRMGGD